jgi:hypothetical protein
VQKILADEHMPAWRKAELIKAFDDQKRDIECRAEGRLPRWRAARLEDLELEIEDMTDED